VVDSLAVIAAVFQAAVGFQEEARPGEAVTEGVIAAVFQAAVGFQEEARPGEAVTEGVIAVVFQAAVGFLEAARPGKAATEEVTKAARHGAAAGEATGVATVADLIPPDFSRVWIEMETVNSTPTKCPIA
jgi:hypothetical protein